MNKDLMNTRNIINKLSDDLTKEIIQQRGSLKDECQYGSAELARRAISLGINLKVEGGLFITRMHTEHNWCVHVESGDLYDPTAEQFSEGTNGLVPENKLDLYIPIPNSEVDDLMKIAAQNGWYGKFTDGVSSLAMGFLYREERRKLLQKVREFYSDLTRDVYSGSSELRTSKTGSKYAVIREPKVTFEFNELEVREWNNNLIVSGETTRSWVVFENTNGSYSIQAINQRAFVSKNGKCGLITKRGDKVILAFNKFGEAYLKEKNNNSWTTLGKNKSVGAIDFYLYLVKEFKELNKL